MAKDKPDTRIPTPGGKTPVVKTPQNKDETGISGHMPRPNAGDDVGKAANNVGLYEEDKDMNNPQEVGIAEEMNENETER